MFRIVAILTGLETLLPIHVCKLVLAIFSAKLIDSVLSNVLMAVSVSPLTTENALIFAHKDGGGSLMLTFALIPNQVPIFL